MKICSRSACQPLALHQRQQDGDRKRKRHESEMGGWGRERACVTRHMACLRRQMFLCAGERWAHTRPVASAIAIPPCDEGTDVWRLHWHAGTFRAHPTFFSNDVLSSPFHLSPSSSPLHLLIRPHFHDSSTVAHTLASLLSSLLFSLLSSVANTHACIVCNLCVCRSYFYYVCICQ